MMRISLFEMIVRGIPEEFMFILAVHAFSKTGINPKRFLLSGVLFWVLEYSIRLLPIQYGIHSIIGLIALIVLVSYINKIDIIKSIRGAISIFILGFVFEGINLLFLQYILKVDLNNLMVSPVEKTLYGLPSVIALGILILSYYIRLSKRKELKYV